MKTIIKKLAGELPLSLNRTCGTFYCFIQEQFGQYLTLLNQVSSSDLESIIIESKEFVGNPSKKRFINLVSKIQSDCLEILKESYKGDLYTSLEKLKSLLFSSGPYNNWLVEVIANYFSISLDSIASDLYRVRDDNKPVEDCWNIPFNLREKAQDERFNCSGTVCMYLSTSLDCCDKEKGAVAKGHTRYAQLFRRKDNSIVPLLDFRVPDETMCDEMTARDQFCFLILYPFYCLCLTKSSHSSSKEPLFVEEYLFSRLFFHMLFLHKDNEICFFDGIIYTSTIDRNAYNIVLPARYSVPENDDHNVESPFLRNRLMNIGPPFPIDSVPKE